MQDFRDRLNRHAEHVKSNGVHCSTEETTKQALVLPFLDILGFSPFDPQKVKAEYSADLPGIKAGERVDYALFSNGQPVMFIEAKNYSEKLTNHTGQVARYFNATIGIKMSAITNGKEWRFFTDLQNANVLDSTPFLTVNLETLGDTDADQLANFRYDHFQTDKLKTFAEQRVYLDLFTGVIGACLRDVDAEFVKFIAARAVLPKQLTIKYLESLAPIIKQAVADALSSMVVSGLSVPPVTPQQMQGIVPIAPAPASDLVDPVNPKIITTSAERKIFDITSMILDGQVPKNEIIGKDTESYYTILFQGKTNRWILRYWGDKGRPQISFQLPFNDQHKAIIARGGMEILPSGNILIDKPENLVKLSPIVMDVLSYCQNDDNYRLKKDVKEP